MKRKEIEQIAKKIIKFEKIIQTSSDKQEKANAEKEIMKLTKNVHSLDDMLAIDEAVLEILEKN
jgi:hypothetical protein